MSISVFRAWSRKWKKMIYHGKDGYTINVCNVTAWKDAADDELIRLMQWTGRKDVKGEPIFEDDLVIAEKKAGKKTVWQVTWDERRCGFILVDTSGEEDQYGKFLRHIDAPSSVIEIIGNIHENPELTRS